MSTKRLAGWATIVAVFAALAGVADISAGDRVYPNVLAAPRAKTVVPAAHVLRQIHLINQTEIRAGLLAREKANTESVRAYGEKLIEDHTYSDRRVEEVATAENINLDVAIPSIDEPLMQKRTALLARLERANGAEFDRIFAEEMFDAHNGAIHGLMRSRDRVNSDKTAALIDEMIPTLAKHETHAETIERLAE